ncbi:putative ADIPOR-like receptor 4 [Elsinoe australis]|uniref:Putative ADIPOR-like receptor 4 n=1 Tax=Elsinoe australis TaxID=40998 RepID=A0A4U7B3V8_9PEZI|nr:putative ADIPOR-like receptor 4 [Elsinoe australis]
MSRQRLKTPSSDSTPPEQVPLVDPKGREDSLLLHWDQVPEWQRDNRYILTGYRRATYSYRKAIGSLAYLHNQTGNIFSHLLAIPTLVTASVVAYHVQEVPLTSVDCVILALFVFGASTCFLLSTSFHTFACHSPTVEELWVRVDFTGIIIITATTFVAGEYYLFYCEKTRMIIHFVTVSAARARPLSVPSVVEPAPEMQTVSLAVLTVIVLLTPRFQGPDYRTFRLICFCLMGISGFVPMIDSLAHYGWEHSKRYSIGYYLVEMLLELLGAATYGCRVPERFAPGKFDIWGHSHQFFHLFSAAAALVHLAGLANALRTTRSFDRCAVGF